MKHIYFGNGVIDLLGLVFIILMIIVIIKIVSSKNYNEKDTASHQKQTLDNFKQLVFAMLTQNSLGLKQHDISSNLGLPLIIVSKKLNKMEREGELTREWSKKEYIYMKK